MPFTFDNSYQRLPERLFARVEPARVSNPSLVAFNAPLAAELGIDAGRLGGPDGAQFLSGNRLPPGAQPIAKAYAGPQFGHFGASRGDGRAILLGEVIDANGRRRDIELKGAGRTPYSRNGDGRAALGPVLREYIVSEAMHALDIPTTRSLAAVATGDAVFRDELLPGAVLTRVAASHLRIGTFQYFAARHDIAALNALVEHALARHYPTVDRQAPAALALLDAVIAAQADLVACWLGVGFIHGVMNTDNMTISGETIDYGPCAFMDEFNPDTVFSSIDRNGRYAYGEQPKIAQWNLIRLAESLLPLIDSDEAVAIERAQASVSRFSTLFSAAWRRIALAKIGIANPRDDDMTLVQDLLETMHRGGLDFTNTFRSLIALVDHDDLGDLQGDWVRRWRERIGNEPGGMPAARALMQTANPQVIARNHQVEHALAAAAAGDYLPFRRLVAALADPCGERADRAWLMIPPGAHERVEATFCGT